MDLYLPIKTHKGVFEVIQVKSFSREVHLDNKSNMFQWRKVTVSGAGFMRHQKMQ